MEPQKGFFSLVQYCPDHSRMEAANIGVVLCVPDAAFVKARMATANDRVRKFFGNKSVDLQWLNSVKESLEKRIEVSKASLVALEEFSRFIATRANRLVLTSPRPVKVYEPDRELESLFVELVDHRDRGPRKGPVIADLDRAFHQPSLANRIKFDEKIMVPIVGRMLYIPYAYQNGAQHFIKPVQFGERVADRGMELAAEGDLIQRKWEKPGKVKVIVVPDLSSQPADRIPEIRHMLNALFGEYKLRTVWEEERFAFVDEVEREAHQL